MKKITLKDKKALSTIITTVLLILLSMIAIFVLWMSVSKLVNKDVLLSPKKCIDFQSQINPVAEIKHACYNQSSNDLIITIKRNSDISFNSLNFVIGSETYSCSKKCNNCKILEIFETKDYFFNLENSNNMPKEISVMVDNCFIQKRKIVEC